MNESPKIIAFKKKRVTQVQKGFTFFTLLLSDATILEIIHPCI